MMEDDTLNINNLPNEILIKIFSYLSVEDIGLNVQFVCSRWSLLCLDDILWKNIFYKTLDNSFEHISSVLEKVPKLQCFRVIVCTAEILNKLAECCRNLLKLVIYDFMDIENCKEALQNLVTACPNLEELTIPSVCLVNEEFAALVGQWLNLRAISLTGTSFESIKLRHIADGCPSLQHLNLSPLKWVYPDLKYFLEQKKNQLLSLRIIPISREGLWVIPLLEICKNSLHLLELIGDFNNCSSDTFSVIKTLSKLTSFKIILPYRLATDVIANAFTDKAMSQLLELKIESSEEVNANLINTVCNNCPNLLKLSLNQCYNLSDDGLKYLYECASLEELHLYYCRSLTDAAIEHVVRCTNLKYLNIGYCGVKSRGLGLLIQLSELRQLELLGYDASELPLHHFPLYLKKLRKLTLQRRVNTDFQFLVTLFEEMPHLKVSLKSSLYPMTA